MNFGSGDNTRAKAWRDIWGAGQGIGAIKRVVPAAELIARLDEEYNAARHRLGLPPWTTTAKDKTAADQCSDVSFRDRLPRRDPYRESAECRACSRGGNASVGWPRHLGCLPSCEFRGAQAVAGQYALVQPSEFFYDQRLHVVTIHLWHFCHDDLPNHG